MVDLPLSPRNGKANKTAVLRTLIEEHHYNLDRATLLRLANERIQEYPAAQRIEVTPNDVDGLLHRDKIKLLGMPTQNHPQPRAGERNDVPAASPFMAETYTLDELKAARQFVQAIRGRSRLPIAERAITLIKFFCNEESE